MKKCKHPPGILIPIVNLSKCEAKGPCVAVCPYDVFELQDITKVDYANLTFLGKIKTFVHGKSKVYAVNADQCLGCGLCVTACPEKAIKLVRIDVKKDFR